MGEERYLEWSLRYGRCRAERIVRSPEGSWPLLWDLDGNGLHWPDLTTREHNSMAANAHHIEGDPLAGLEVLLASGAIYALGDLFLLSGEDIFRDAARRMAAALVPEILDPFGDPAAAALAYYRWTFADASLDLGIADQIGRMPSESDGPWVMMFPQDRKRRELGVGRRTDMIYWGEWSEDGTVTPLREPSTAALALAYQVTGDITHARRAFRAASTKLSMARRVLRGGREHADMGGAICSVAAGHGRNWGIGAVTGCYGPLVLGTREIRSQVSPLIEVRDCDGHTCVPDSILTLVRPGVGDDAGALVIYNGTDSEVGLSWRPSAGKATAAPNAPDNDSAWTHVILAADESLQQALH